MQTHLCIADLLLFCCFERVRTTAKASRQEDSALDE